MLSLLHRRHPVLHFCKSCINTLYLCFRRQHMYGLKVLCNRTVTKHRNSLLQWTPAKIPAIGVILGHNLNLYAYIRLFYYTLKYYKRVAAHTAKANVERSVCTFPHSLAALPRHNPFWSAKISHSSKSICIKFFNYNQVELTLHMFFVSLHVSFIIDFKIILLVCKS